MSLQITLRALLLNFLMIIVLALSAQSPCAVSDIDQRLWMDRYVRNLRNREFTISRSTRHLPIVFHLFARDNGTGRSPLNNVLDLICTTQQLLDSTGVNLYLIEDGLHEVNHEGIYFQHQLASNQQAMRGMKVDSAINVYVVSDAGSGSSGSVLGYYDSQDDWIVISRNQLKKGNVTLVHEIGHFFSLIHTHFGWDSQAWNATIHGPKSASISPDGLTEVEKMDGSNCSTAGDMLCDTPPDYNLGLNWSQSCDYNGDARDPDSTVLDPDETLIMSYFSDACRTVFSVEQIAIMQADWDSPDRAFLHRLYSPVTDTIVESPSALMPAAAVQTSTGEISFSWSEAEGATHYLLQVDRASGFNLSPQDFIVTDTMFTVSGSWIEQSTYFWRVFAFHESSTCQQPSAISSFSIEYVTGLFPELTSAEWKAFYDPTNLTITISGANSGGVFELTNLEGRIISVIQKSTDETYASIKIPQLPAGLYFLREVGRDSPPQKILIR